MILKNQESYVVFASLGAAFRRRRKAAPREAKTTLNFIMLYFICFLKVTATPIGKGSSPSAKGISRRRQLLTSPKPQLLLRYPIVPSAKELLVPRELSHAWAVSLGTLRVVLKEVA